MKSFDMIVDILKNENITINSLVKFDKFFSKQNLEVKKDIFQQKKNEFFKLKNENSSADHSALELVSFYVAINNFYNLKEKINKRNENLSTKELKDYENLMINSIEKDRKITMKENFIIDKSSIINKLIQQNTSLRNMSIFFKNNYKKNISHTFINNTIRKYPNIFESRNANG